MKCCKIKDMKEIGEATQIIRIIAKRGDTKSLTFSFINMPSLYEAYFTIKAKPTDEEHLVQKKLGDGITEQEDGTYHVRIAPEDTADIPAGEYVYDLQISITNDDEQVDTYTPFEGQYILTQDVTN